MTQERMKRWFRLLLQLLSLFVFLGILWWAGPEPWRQILNSDWRPLSVALLIYGGAGIVSSLRLRLVAQSLVGGEVASRRRFYYLSMVARVLGLILPRSVSALGGKSVGLRALGISLRRSVWIVMMDNLYDVLSLSVVAFPALFFLQGQLQTGAFVALTLVLWVLLALAIWIVLTNNRLQPLLAWLTERVPWLSRRLQLDQPQAINLFPASQRATGALLWTILLNLLLISTYYTIAEALGISASWWIFAASFPLTQLSLIIAVAPGGLGVFDLGWFGLLRLGGVSQEDALTFVVAQRAFILIFVLIWAAVSALLSFSEEGTHELIPAGEAGGSLGTEKGE